MAALETGANFVAANCACEFVAPLQRKIDALHRLQEDGVREVDLMENFIMDPV
jgi:hypothetical protein